MICFEVCKGWWNFFFIRGCVFAFSAFGVVGGTLRWSGLSGTWCFSGDSDYSGNSNYRSNKSYSDNGGYSGNSGYRVIFFIEYTL